MVADGISQKWEGLPRQMGDGSEWTVCNNWEGAAGLANDVLNMAPDSDMQALKERFKDEPVFKEVLDGMLAINGDYTICNQRRAWH